MAAFIKSLCASPRLAAALAVGGRSYGITAGALKPSCARNGFTRRSDVGL